MVRENIRMAIASMAGSRLRTFLSLLGIMIGVASVVAILNLGRSVTESMSSSFEVGGLDTISIMPRGAARETMIFTEEFAYSLMSEIDGIREVLPVVSSAANVRNGQEISEGVMIQGVTSDYFASNSLEADDGAFFSAIDNINRRQVAVIGPELADELFPGENPVGKYISVFRHQAKSFQVIGVLRERDEAQGTSYNYTLFIPYNTYVQRFRRTDQVGTYVVKTAEGYDATDVADDIEEYLDEIAGSDYYRIFSPATIKEMADSVMSTFSMFLAAIAAISLVVGGIGIMNIMLVSVVERTGEIGIRKALGATPGAIRSQFLVESVTLSLSGGLLGLVIGTVLSMAAVNIAGWPLYISPGAILVSLAFSLAIGIFFGWYPAAKAARLEPMEALQRD